MTADDTGPGKEPVPGGSDPLHGVTLEAMLQALVERLGWEGLSEKIPARCFSSDPSLPSSLKFLRKTPWAREKLELLYLYVFHPAEAARRAKARRDKDDGARRGGPSKRGPSKRGPSERGGALRRKGPPRDGGPRKGER